MSTLKVNKIRDTSGSADAITLDPSGGAVLAGVTTMTTARITTGITTSIQVGGGVTISESGIEASGIGITCANINGGQISGRRNIVINGAMMVSQRGNQSATSSAGYYACDRFYTSNGSNAAVAVNQSTDSPDDFGFSYHLDCTTADTSIAAGQYFLVQYRIEGQDIQRFDKGTSSAKQFALSFYLKATKTGLYTVELEDTDNQRQISKTITVSDTNWNRYVLIFPADTSGAFNNDQNSSLTINWWLLAGSTYNGGTVNTSSWASITQANRASGSNVNAMDSTSNDFRLTGVQLEVGDQATAFEHRSFGEELALCQRYFYRIGGKGNAYQLVGNGFIGLNGGTRCAKVVINFPTTMRATPTLEVIGTDSFSADTGGAAATFPCGATATGGGLWSAASTGDIAWLDFGRTSGGEPAVGTAVVVYTTGAAGECSFTAEL